LLQIGCNIEKMDRNDMAAPPNWLEENRPASVAVLRALQLGDMLCAVPALRALRQCLPRVHLTLVGLPWAAQFAQRYPHYIDAFMAFPGHPAFPEQPVRQEALGPFYAAMRARHFDVALQLHGSGEHSNEVVRGFGARHVAGFGLNGLAFPAAGPEPLRLLALPLALGAPAVPPTLEFPITAQDRRELAASGVAAALPHGAYACIHPGARWRDKCWPATCFAQVADALAEAFGLVSHIAAGLGLPSVVIFSKADMARWAPLDQARHRCLWDPAGARVGEAIAQARELLLH
jgi:ADP-heptose:LPS heptosyltransferase